jgi:hypothetical protein
MQKKIFALCGGCLFSVLIGLPVSAQEVATLVLRDGQRPSGDLIDLNARGFTLRVNGQDLTFSTNDVAAVVFAGGAPPAEAEVRIDTGHSLIVLRSGQIIDGRLVDIGGTHPLRLTVDTPSGQRDFTSSDVAQVYLQVPRSAAAQAAAEAEDDVIAGAIIVQGNQPWTDSGIRVRKGDRIAFSGTGDIMIAEHASSGVAGSPAVTSPTSRYPVGTSPVGTLIARIGNGAPFAIGTNTQPMTMLGAGQLFLGVNDDYFADNSGTYAVIVTR